jgi:hypothetical protein
MPKNFEPVVSRWFVGCDTKLRSRIGPDALSLH